MIRIGIHFGETGPPGWIPEDVNQDGVINVLDMILVGMNWTVIEKEYDDGESRA
jgi:hypothetical protein